MATKTKAARDLALERFLGEFEKRHAGSLLTTDSSVDVVPTGSLALDYALGCGGFVKGRVIELWGQEQTCKSTLLTIVGGNYQRAHPDKLVGWIDVEATFDSAWAQRHGLDVDRRKLVLERPPNAEDVANAVKDMIVSDHVGFVVLDSVGAMIPQAEIDKDAGDATVGLVAKTVTRMVKIAAAEASRRQVILAIVNQVRANLSYGGDLTRSGGHALTHVSTHRLRHKRTSTKPFLVGSKTDGSEEQVGQEIAIYVEKNKMAPPKRTALVTFFNQDTEKYGPIGIDAAVDVFRTGRMCGVFGRRGSWYDLPDGTEHNGEDAVVHYLRVRPEAREIIRQKVLDTRAHEIILDPIKEG